MTLGDSPSAAHIDLLNAWTEAPAGMTADSPDRIDPNGVPQLNSALFTDNVASNSTRFLEKANYIVFKNINISYDLPKKWVNAIKLSNINLGVSIDNLFTKSCRKGFNPQQTFTGTTGLGYVTPRVYSFQLTARF